MRTARRGPRHAGARALPEKQEESDLAPQAQRYTQSWAPVRPRSVKTGAGTGGATLHAGHRFGPRKK